MSTREQRLADLLEAWRYAECAQWLLRYELEEAEQRAARARKAYEKALQGAATVAPSSLPKAASLPQ